MVEVVNRDESRDGRAFESIMSALEEVAPRWEVTEPGRCAVPSLGPSKYHGGDRKLLEVVRTRVLGALEDEFGTEAHLMGLGVAIVDGPRAAAVVAEQVACPEVGFRSGAPTHPPRRARGILCLPAGGTAEYLAPMPTHSLRAGGNGWGKPVEMDDLVDLLRRLGLKNLGRFAALEPADVLARFGAIGRSAHDFARGRERNHLVLSKSAEDLSVTAEIDPPAAEVERAAFVVKTLADSLQENLSSRGLACTRILVVAETELGDRIERLWRDEGTLGPTAIAQRTRWQLDAWLMSGRTASRELGGVSRVALVPDQVVPDEGRQLGFWGGSSRNRDRAMKAVGRIQALLGHSAVLVPEWHGGRAPGERFRQVPLEMVDLDSRVGRDDRPWPGSMPPPAPAIIWDVPEPVDVLDGEGCRVVVDGRGQVSAAPQRVKLGARWIVVEAWAGPWCAEERWWDPEAHRRRARLQVVLKSAGAHLLALESRQWRIEASYD
jgi:protein ImuB